MELTSAAPGNLPLAKHVLFRTKDLDEARERVSRVFCEHKLTYLRQKSRLDMRQHVVKFGNLALSYIAYGSEVGIDPGLLSSFFLVHLVPKGGCQINIGRHELVGSAAVGTVTSPTLPMRMRWNSECAHLVVKIDRAAIERHLSHLLDDVITRPIEFHPKLAVQHGPGASLRRLIEFVASEMDRDEALLRSSLSVTSIEQTLMTALLTAQSGNYSAALAARTLPPAPRHVARAEDFIRAHPELPITIGDLAAASGVSVRALYEGFRRFRATTPMALLRAVRLERVHNELQSAAGMQTIANVAFKWGIVHLGRFAAEYRNRYGELPSETISRRK